MQIQEGGVVSAPLIGGRTPARGIGYAPVDLDAPDEEWEVEPVGDADEPPPAALSASISPSKMGARSIVAMAGVVGFVGGVMVAAVGLTTRRPPALLGRAAALLQPKAIQESERAPPVVPVVPTPAAQAPLPVLPALVCAPQDSDTAAATTADAAPDSPSPPAKPRRKPVKRAPKALAPKPAGSWAGWVDPFAD
jgi:hypothetical protein